MLKILLIFAVLVCIVLVAMISVQSNCFSTKKVSFGQFEPQSESSTLVVLLHSFSNERNSLNSVRKEIEDHYGTGAVDFIHPNMPLGTMSVAKPERILAELLGEIDSAWDSREDIGKPYERVLLVGHSLGALLARKLYLIGMGETSDAPFESAIVEEVKALGLLPITVRRPWAKHVDRLVLMAGMNKGWSISHHMSLSRAVAMQSGIALGWLVEQVSGQVPVILRIRKGSPFIIQLRLQWLAMEQNRSDVTSVVQLLGTVDDLVSPEDNIDLVTGQNFRYFEMPYSGHGDVIELDRNTEEGSARADVFSRVLNGQKGEEEFVLDVYDHPEIDGSVKAVVFVIHGIRDRGYWTKKIMMRINKEAKYKFGDDYQVASETSSYGYFPMLSFLNPGERQEKVAWLMDKYTEAKASYPNAQFHYVGHSHGTYLLAKAMDDYESVSFDHVAFAGSVVKTNYKWNELIGAGRVKAVYNFKATHDWVVALFPKSLQLIGWQDLGSAGHDGFVETVDVKKLYESDYVIGAHSAALNERIWTVLADFILEGNDVELDQKLVRSDPVRLLDELSKAAWIVPLGIIIILLGGLYLLINAKIADGLKATYIIVYVYAIWLVVTRV